MKYLKTFESYITKNNMHEPRFNGMLNDFKFKLGDHVLKTYERTVYEICAIDPYDSDDLNYKIKNIEGNVEWATEKELTLLSKEEEEGIKYNL